MEDEQSIMEEREDLMISSKGGKPTKKIAHFIKPTLSSTDLTPKMPTTHLPPKPISLKCYLNGWRYPTQSWVSWVDRLHSSYQYIWKRAGIYDAILSSKYKIVKNEDLFFGLAERWCCETNTFVFPWGEATITLEDVAVLGGFSVLGDSVSGSVDVGDFAETEKKLTEAYVEIARGSCQKADQGIWMKHFMGLGPDSGIEHEAFLSLWLSRFVLPTFPFKVIAKRFFKIAICLARGVQIALAPVVLASIYRDLSLLKCGVVNVSGGCNIGDVFDDLVVVTLWAPLQLVQVWAWERFPGFRPWPGSIVYGEPRLARWHDVNEKEIGNVRPLLQSAGESFEWRPYCKHVENLPLPMFYKQTEERVVVWDGLGDDMKMMVRFLRVCELVGMDTVEQYNPHRVAMQFGFDQDVPKIVKRDLLCSDIPKRELVQLAWLTYINPIRDENLYVPSKSYEPQVTLRYLKWVRQGVLARHAILENIVRKRRNLKRKRRSQVCFDAVDLHRLFKSVTGVDELDAPPVVPSKSCVVSKVSGVPPGFKPKNHIGHGAQVIDVPPSVGPNIVGDNPAFCFSPKFNESIILCAEKHNRCTQQHGPAIDIPPGYMSMACGFELDAPPGFAPKSDLVGKMTDVPPGVTPKNHIINHGAQVIDVPPGFLSNTAGNNLGFCFSPKYSESTTSCVGKQNGYTQKHGPVGEISPSFMSKASGFQVDAPPGFPPKPDLVSKMADVSPGFTPKNHIGHGAQVMNVPPGFVPNAVGNHLAFYSSSKSYESTTLCGGKQKGYALESEIKVKKECVEPNENSQPLLWCRSQNSPAGSGFKGSVSSKVEAGNNSGKSVQVRAASLGQDSMLVNSETTQTLALDREGKSGRSMQRCTETNLEARIKQLEKMVAELSQAR